MTLLSNGTTVGPNDHIILLLGASGSGKSTFIDIASGRKDKSAVDSLEPKKPKIQTIRVAHPDPENGSAYVLVEAPGLDRAEGRSVTRDYLKDLQRKDVGLSAVIYLHQISDKRTSASPLDNLGRFPRVWDARNVSLVTTMWGNMDQYADECREVELKTLLLPGPQIDRFDRFEDTPMSAWAIIDKAVSGDDEATLFIQDINYLASQLGESSMELDSKIERFGDTRYSSAISFGEEIFQIGYTSSDSDCSDKAGGGGKPLHLTLQTLIGRWESIFRKIWVAVHQGVVLSVKRLRKKLERLGMEIMMTFGELEEMRIIFGRSLRMISTFCGKNLYTPVSTVSELDLEEESSDDEVLIVVLGSGGSGKSTFINKLTGSNLEVFDGLKSCARPVQLGNTINWGGRTVNLIDTPGFDVTEPHKIIKGIFDVLGQDRKFGGVIYLHPIYPGRPETIPEPVPRLTENLCRTKGLKRLVVVRTWDSGASPRNEEDLKGATIIDYPDFDQVSDINILQSQILGPIFDA